MDKQKEYQQFMCQLNESVLDLTKSLKFDKKHPWHLHLIQLYGSILELHGSATLLLKGGAGIGIPILLRSALEAFVDFINLAADKKYGYNLKASELQEWIKLLKESRDTDNPFLASIGNFPERDAILEEMQEKIAELKKDGYKSLLQNVLSQITLCDCQMRLSNRDSALC